MPIRLHQVASLARSWATLFAVGSLSACAQPLPPASPEVPKTLVAPFTGYVSAHYKDPKAWLCLPGRADACAANLDATELRADGSRAVVHEEPSPIADKVDCFYVYPTVDLSLAPANHQTFDDLAPMTRATVAQAARFRTTCRLFVPLYRQATIGAYLRGAETRDAYLGVAASDVQDAFVHYMATYNQGRKVVLIGHSQGAEMVTRLLTRFFDNDPTMRERLLVALPIGGHLDTATGQTAGGTFEHLPECTRPGEVGCVIGYRSFLAGTDVAPGNDAPHIGRESLCVDPPTLEAGGPKPYSRAFILLTDENRGRMKGIDGVTTPFVMLRDFYEGHCVSGRDGFRYLAVATVAPAGPDGRVSPVDLSSRWLRTKLGLHVLDMQLAQGDLVDLVARRVAALK
jgi:hypothetical protein